MCLDLQDSSNMSNRTAGLPSRLVLHRDTSNLSTDSLMGEDYLFAVIIKRQGSGYKNCIFRSGCRALPQRL